MSTMGPGYNSGVATDLKECASRIANCVNRADFAKPILRSLNTSSVTDEAKTRLFVLARRICSTWTNAERQQLTDACIQQLASESFGIAARGPRVNANTQAIYTMSVSANTENLKKLIPLHSRYRAACLYAHAKTQTEIPWIISQLNSDVPEAINRRGASLQNSAHACAVALANNGHCKVDVATRQQVLDKLLQAIKGRISYDILIVCIIALGTMCDSRFVPAPFSATKIKSVEECLNTITRLYPNRDRTEKNCQLVLKMIHGDTLSADEECFLLTKLEL